MVSVLPAMLASPSITAATGTDLLRPAELSHCSLSAENRVKYCAAVVVDK